MQTAGLPTLLDALRQAPRPADTPAPRLLAVSKMQPASAIRALAGAGQQAFGENYVQEALTKQGELTDLPIEWHLIGHLQSNKASLAANAFDWVQSVDRPRIVDALANARDPGRSPLNVLIQVNIDGEPGKQGCAPAEVAALATRIARYPTLTLRGLMAIPAPSPDPDVRRAAFEAMARAFATLRAGHPGADTLSMGMSDDYPLAIACGANLVRIGRALFGERIPT